MISTSLDLVIGKQSRGAAIAALQVSLWICSESMVEDDECWTLDRGCDSLLELRI